MPLLNAVYYVKNSTMVNVGAQLVCTLERGFLCTHCCTTGTLHVDNSTEENVCIIIYA